jgi:hypothetical protein
MSSDSVFIAHPTTTAQIDALKAIGKALDLKFEIKKNIKEKASVQKSNSDFNNLKNGFEEMKLIEEGKLKGTSLDDFLNEL